MRHPHQTAYVIGSGPNGLAAAIALAQQGLRVEVFEAQPVAGGAARTLPLTLPGFLHDFGSAVHPMGAGSPFFRTLPLHRFGLEWLHHPAPLAHPLDDGTAVTLEHDLDTTAKLLGQDGPAWQKLAGPLAQHWDAFSAEILGPLLHIPRHPLLIGRFGISALQPARMLACLAFRSERTRALFAGIAAHSFLSLGAPASSATGLVLGAAAHAPGWPIPCGGSQAITSALMGCLASLGGTVHTSHTIHSLAELPSQALILCDVTPRQLLALAGDRLPAGYRRALAHFKRGPGSFKIDYALSAPIPWRAADCARAATVHVGGTINEVAAAEDAVARGRHAERPFVLVAQPSLIDATRAPQGRHVAWMYCHVPFGSNLDMTTMIERQIERFAPGFRDCILARSVSSPARLEQMDANLAGGDISGGGMSLAQTLLRPTWRSYATPDPNLFLCSSSTPPGGGVHGMCGYHAARAALAQK